MAFNLRENEEYWLIMIVYLRKGRVETLELTGNVIDENIDKRLVTMGDFNARIVEYMNDAGGEQERERRSMDKVIKVWGKSLGA